MSIKIYLLAICILPFSAAGQINSSSKPVQNVYSEGENQIVYLFFKIKKDNSGKETIVLEERKKVKGKLKFLPNSDTRYIKSGEFLVTFTDAEGKMVSEQVIENPLAPEFEVFDKEISRYKANLSESEFSLRYAHSENIKQIRIEKISDSGKQLIFTQKL